MGRRRAGDTDAREGERGSADWAPKRWVREHPALSLVIWLLLVAGAGAVGTSNALPKQMLAGAGPLGPALLIGLAALAAAVPDPAPRRALLLFPVLVLAGGFAAQAVIGTVFKPYRIQGNLLGQDQSVQGIPALDGIRVDDETSRSLRSVVQAVEAKSGFQPGDPIVEIAEIPGYVYALGGYGPGSNWVSEADASATCNAWRDNRAAVQASSAVLVRDVPAPELDRCLSRVWPAYPADMRLVARSTTPDGIEIRILVPTGNAG
jgi:hypothetical protein